MCLSVCANVCVAGGVIRQCDFLKRCSGEQVPVLAKALVWVKGVEVFILSFKGGIS